MNTTELLKKVRKIEIKTKGLSNHIFSGEYHSTFKGRGMSFSEVRAYQYGDDVRNIDWNVTARTGDPFIKIFEEERELTVILLIDVSQSSFFGLANLKNEIITEISAVLSFSAINNNDKVGVIFFSDKVEKFIPPKKGKQHILRIIRELINFEPSGHGTNIKLALEYFTNLVKKRTICFMLSDFMDSGYDTALRIAARRHDLVGIHLYDEFEKSLPNVGMMRVHDAETNDSIIIDTSSKKVRDQYESHFQNQYDYFTNAFKKSGADTMSICTNESYVNALMKFFKKRHK